MPPNERVLHIPQPGDHRDPVTPVHLPGGDPEPDRKEKDDHVTELSPEPPLVPRPGRGGSGRPRGRRPGRERPRRAGLGRYHIVYSHHHADHLGASSLFGRNVTRIGQAVTGGCSPPRTTRPGPCPTS